MFALHALYKIYLHETVIWFHDNCKNRVLQYSKESVFLIIYRYIKTVMISDDGSSHRHPQSAPLSWPSWQTAQAASLQTAVCTLFLLWLLRRNGTTGPIHTCPVHCFLFLSLLNPCMRDIRTGRIDSYLSSGRAYDQIHIFHRHCTEQNFIA